MEVCNDVKTKVYIGIKYNLCSFHILFRIEEILNFNLHIKFTEC